MNVGSNTSGTIRSTSNTARTIANAVRLSGGVSGGNPTRHLFGSAAGNPGGLNGDLTFTGLVSLETPSGGGLRVFEVFNTTRFDGDISGAGGILLRNITGPAGTLILAGDNSFTGGITVDAGTLLVNNTAGSGTGSGAVTVSASGTLGGTGTIGGNTTVNGTVGAGTSAGSLEFGNNLTLPGTAVFEIGGTAFTLNGTEQYDRIKLTLDTATLNLTGSTLFVFDIGHTFADNDRFGIFQLGANATRTGLLGGFAEGATVGTFDGKALQITYLASFGDSGPIALTGGNDIALYVIPEPSTFAMILGGFGMLLGLQRARRRK